ncbi:flagellar export chaperone FlgN [Dactylosporangium sp. CA-139114]|uniref:flagellar export chaperone FlgN n=1 Tax=Dactylosporangium sp. CA-139114 TaxID=3239931 RepID=UPI003D966890
MLKPDMDMPNYRANNDADVRRAGRPADPPREGEAERMTLADLASILWREREMLELLLFKLEEEQLVLASGRTRWLAHATREVEVVLEEIRRTEVVRAAEVEAIGAEFGLGPNPSLSKLAEAAPAPWSDLLNQHRKAFLTITAEVSAIAEANRDLLTTGARAARETMLAVVGSVETYGRKGETVAAAPRTRLIDEAM